MHVYIVVSDLNGYHPNYPNGSSDVFNKRELALECAVSVAKGDVSVGGTDQIFKLKKVIRIDVDSLKSIEMELILDKGTFILVEKLKSAQ